jgi:hypothetical protein
MEFKPDVILELGRDSANSTVAFTEAANRMGGNARGDYLPFARVG